MSEWQPIETAPKNGQFMVASCKSAAVVVVDYGDFCLPHSEPLDFSPTHWAPLINLPEAIKE